MGVKQPGEWLNRRYNSDRIRRQGDNDTAVEAQRRCGALAVERTYLDDEPRVGTYWDVERRRREEEERRR